MFLFMLTVALYPFEQHSTVFGLLELCIFVAIVHVITTAVYLLYFSPLSKYPGPSLNAISRIPLNYHAVTGNRIKHLTQLHCEYGPIVRIGPCELSYTDAAAWPDIYGPKNDSIGRQMPKDPAFYSLDRDAKDKSGAALVAELDDASHAQQRKVFSAAFSERALRAQEGLISGYVDKLVEKLRERQNAGEQVDMVKMLNFTTFDIMSDLAFNAPLNLLEKNAYHEWVATIFDNLHAMVIIQTIMQYSTIKWMINNLMPPSLKAQRDKHHAFSRDRVDARLKQETTRPDIWQLIIDAHGDSFDIHDKVQRDVMYDNAGLFMIAGTETSATLLSGLLFLLLTQQDHMQRLQREIRALREDQLNLLEVPKLEYLNACIEEALRVYPPVPGGLPRKTPPGGAIIAGKHVPGNDKTTVSIPHYAMYHSPTNFSDPGCFSPERWLSSQPTKDLFIKDRKEAFNPFSTGPRNCLGKNLAYHEIRLILAKLIWNFDFELHDRQIKWLDQRVLLLWDKKPLMVRVKTVQR